MLTYIPPVTLWVMANLTSFTKKPGGDQTVTMDLDDPDSGVSLDRANYPQNTGVVITIDDQALNVDPTSGYDVLCGSTPPWQSALCTTDNTNDEHRQYDNAAQTPRLAKQAADDNLQTQ